MADLEKLRKNILEQLNHYYFAWSQWPGNLLSDARSDGMRMAIMVVEREFEKVMKDE